MCAYAKWESYCLCLKGNLKFMRRIILLTTVN
ncbi:hypothetical protein MTR67_011959 [Solanum verrucosum]|uniref:Uncharacterized protein n=1 Tax=Solanum verrucosum TaxID=315347 RepID=A0AAF0QEU5_SOLVR|nr:hypothetical protein MTR67_011959 [Solanum verrucosum]